MTDSQRETIETLIQALGLSDDRVMEEARIAAGESIDNLEELRERAADNLINALDVLNRGVTAHDADVG